MDGTFTDLSYSETGYFSNIVNAYIQNDIRLSPFIKYPVSTDGLAKALEQRKTFPVNRIVLQTVLEKQYSGIDTSGKVAVNINLLLKENTFTVCTAHQPAIFTGSLFFIYKIIHAIRLTENLQKQFPENNFVPVFYMGSEDADLDELGNIFLNGDKIEWKTTQKGAVGKMKPEGLEKIIDRIEGELVINPHGEELIALLKICYLESPDIQTGTLKLIHHLFASYGLVVLLPDNATLKRLVSGIFEDELLHQRSAAMVSKTVEKMSASFKVQAHPRDINLFYLRNDIRERIERKGEEWQVLNTGISFNRQGILNELNLHPERFSPNVILRGIFQETILPNVAFIGGGGELAYWMELKELFDHYQVSYPVLVVRNSFMIIEKKWKQKLDKLQLSIPALFQDQQSLSDQIVKRDSGKKLSLTREIQEITEIYAHILETTKKIDSTLTAHVDALRERCADRLQKLEKKMLKAEKRKFADALKQLSSIKKELFPNDGLQERVDNFMPYYSKWGNDFIRMIYDHSYTLEQRFAVLVVK